MSINDDTFFPKRDSSNGLVWECNNCGFVGDLDHACNAVKIAVEVNVIGNDPPRVVVLLHTAWYYGNLILQTTCHSYEDYNALPPVVSYTGVDCGLTGWNSDTETARYKSGAAIIRKVTNKR
jgi:hypothetical protein